MIILFSVFRASPALILYPAQQPARQAAVRGGAVVQWPDASLVAYHEFVAAAVHMIPRLRLSLRSRPESACGCCT